MRVLVVPLNCRLSSPHLEDIVGAANWGVKDMPLTFELAARHRLRRYIDRDDLLQYISRNFPPRTLAIVSRQIAYDAHFETIGLADADLRAGVVRAEYGYRGELRNKGVAQTLMHEFMHLIGRDHHTEDVVTRGLYCPFMEYSPAESTSVRLCDVCSNDLRKFVARAA